MSDPGPTLKQLSDQEQIEARIETLNQKFMEDMRRLDESHARFLKRMSWWDAFAQGAACGAAAMFVITMVMIVLTKHK